MSDYTEIIGEHLQKIRGLRDQQLAIAREIKHSRELVKAALNMLPDEQKGPYLAQLGEQSVMEVGLTGRIQALLQKHDFWLTPVEIKQHLEAGGYDFSEYKSNPLSSIYAVLKRFKPAQVQTTHLPDGSTGYRWKKKKAGKK